MMTLPDTTEPSSPDFAAPTGDAIPAGRRYSCRTFALLTAAGAVVGGIAGYIYGANEPPSTGGWISLSSLAPTIGAFLGVIIGPFAAHLLYFLVRAVLR